MPDFGTTPAAATPETPAAPAAAANDHCGGRCSDILPPGQNGTATLAQTSSTRPSATRPAHAGDQLGPYAGRATG
ncbi:Penicillin acylase OS=Streptomyces glaucescens OX=1907 GN=SGLAU_07425 PE=3 SV=1 [Streptomyces glaucescens]